MPSGAPGRQTAPGLWPGYCVKNEDPKQAGRIIAAVPGMFDKETPYWCHPLGWRDDKERGYGTARIPKMGAPVILQFIFGDPNEGAYYQLGAAGAPGGYSGAPTPMSVASSWSQRIGTKVLHEDSVFVVYAQVDTEGDTKLLTLHDKRTGSNITLDSGGGESKKAGGIIIEGETDVQIKSLYGRVKIDGARVVINGRLVHGGTDTI